MNQEIERYLSGNMDTVEEQAFLQRTEQDMELRNEVIKMKNMQALLGLAGQPGDDDGTQKGLDTFNAMLEARNKRRWTINLLKYAAVIVILVIATWMVSSRYTLYHEPQQFTEIEVPKGQCVSLTLADGSRVWLSPLSKMRIPNQFNKRQRSIELDGEGYFAINRDEEKPFTVKTGQYNIQVLGTEFNVFAYSKQMAKFETCLVKGKVKVYSAQNEEDAIYLKPNEKALLVDNQMVKQVSDFGDGEYAKKGIFSFRMKAFREILDYLELWYDIRFAVQGDVDLDRKISGKFRQNGEASVVLDALKGIYDFGYRKVDDDNYIIFK